MQEFWDTSSTTANQNPAEPKVHFRLYAAQPHIHPLQSELFEVEKGKLGLICERKEVTLTEGQSFTVPSNAAHRCFAKNGKEVVLRTVFTPALNIEYALTELYAACNIKNSKAPPPFDATYVLLQAPGEYYLAD